MRIDSTMYYYHHMMVVEVINTKRIQVIHYTGAAGKGEAAAVLVAAVSSTSHDQSVIIEEKIDIDVGNATLELLRYAPGVAKHTGTKAIDRARSRLGEREYNVATNNCECFINWAITEKSESGQVDTVVKVAAGVGLAVGVAAVGGAILYGLFGGKKKQKDFDD